MVGESDCDGFILPDNTFRIIDGECQIVIRIIVQYGIHRPIMFLNEQSKMRHNLKIAESFPQIFTFHPPDSDDMSLQMYPVWAMLKKIERY